MSDLSEPISVAVYGDSQVANKYSFHKDHTDAWRSLMGRNAKTLYMCGKKQYNSEGILDHMDKFHEDMTQPIHIHSIMVGGNDAIREGVPPYQHVSKSQFRSNLLKMIEKITAKAEKDKTPTRVVIETPIPIYFEGMLGLTEGNWWEKESSAGMTRPISTSKSGVSSHVRKAASNATTAEYAQVVSDVVGELNDDVDAGFKPWLLTATAINVWDPFTQKFTDGTDLNTMYLDGLHWYGRGQDIFESVVTSQEIPGLASCVKTHELPSNRVVDLGTKLPAFSAYRKAKRNGRLNDTYFDRPVSETDGLAKKLSELASQAWWSATHPSTQDMSEPDIPQLLSISGSAGTL